MAANNDSENLDRLVHPGDVLAAARSAYGPSVNIGDLDVARVTTSVQGYLSLMLRVRTTIYHPETSSTHPPPHPATFMVKRLPIIPGHRELVSSGCVFEREITFYRKIVPVLEQKQQNLPLARVYCGHNDIIVMEDLCQEGYNTIITSVKDINRGIMGLSHIKLVVRKLATLHVASLGTNWQEIYPMLLSQDPLYDTFQFFKDKALSGLKSIVIAMKEFYPAKVDRYAPWLLDGGRYKFLSSLSKTEPGKLKVLCHGDTWLNNIMFKLDHETSKPVDVKFVDMQLFSYTHPTRDLLYFLYICTNKNFRDVNEKDIVKTYVEAFNTFACQTPDLLSLESFYQEFDHARLFGLLMAIVLKPMVFLDGYFPENDESFSDEHYDSLTQGNPSGQTLDQLEKNSEYRSIMKELVDEIMEVMDKKGFCD